MGRSEPGASGPLSESDLRDNLCEAVCSWEDGRGKKWQEFSFSKTLPGFMEMSLIFFECP